MKNIYVMILIVIEFILIIDIKSIVYGIYVWKLDIDLMFMYIG